MGGQLQAGSAEPIKYDEQQKEYSINESTVTYDPYTKKQSFHIIVPEAGFIFNGTADYVNAPTEPPQTTICGSIIPQNPISSGSEKFYFCGSRDVLSMTFYVDDPKKPDKSVIASPVPGLDNEVTYYGSGTWTPAPSS